MAPQRAKGRAKMECSHLIISKVTRRLWRTGTEVMYQFSVLSSQFSVLSSSSQFSVFGSRFSVFAAGPCGDWLHASLGGQSVLSIWVGLEARRGLVCFDEPDVSVAEIGQ